MTSRDWCSRISNPDAWLPVEDWQYLSCAVWQLEIGEGGLVHYQLFLHFSRAVRMAFVKSLEGMNGAWLGMRKGTKLQAAEYCCKEEGRLEGPFWYPSEEKVREYCAQGPGRRNDIHKLTALVREGANDARIADEMPVMIVKYHKGIAALRDALDDGERNAEEIDSVVYVGPSGTGKSYRLHRECPPGPDWFWVSPGGWFDGYNGEPGLVFDEFRDSWFPYSDLLKLVDVYPHRVEKKGAVLKMKAVRFRFSTNVKPEDWYHKRPGKPSWEEDPLRRRLRVIEYMVVPYVPDVPNPIVVIGSWPGYVSPAAAPLVADAQGRLWNGRDYE